MTLQTETIQIITDSSRGIDTAEAMSSLLGRYGLREATASVKEAGERQTALIYALRLAASQAGLLASQIDAMTTAATALKSTLETAKVTATIDLDNSDAGDTAITALTTLLTALNTALAAVRAIPNLNYASYRDE
jgi:hypothetical protein